MEDGGPSAFNERVRKYNKERKLRERDRERRKRKHKSIYIGESSKDGFRRSQQHYRRYKSCMDDSFMWRHLILFHEELLEESTEEMEELARKVFGFEVIRFYRTPLERMVHESVMIKNLTYS